MGKATPFSLLHFDGSYNVLNNVLHKFLRVGNVDIVSYTWHIN